ncbi:MAG: hypothetical protein SPL61_09225 [Saccharofermentans sp.]|nr:hypothetical protein [Saccharofermentans sp.]
MERAVIQFKHDNNIELLRQRIKIYSSRVVIGRATDDSTFDWLTKGLVANYNELRHHMDSLIPETESFMKKLYFDLFRRHGITPIPYFLIQSCREDSIYNILSNMRRNRTLVFQEKMGVSRYTLIYWIKKINPYYNDIGKEYYQVVMDYLSLIKIE